jgi:ABC-type phosphate transport system substrate-binding protein
MKSRLIILLVAFLCVFKAHASEQVLAVIVAQDFANKEPSAKELNLIYRKKIMSWSDGSRIHPVNLPSDHPLRKVFSMSVLKSLPESQAQYWNDLYYHGISPPHVFASSEAAMRFVMETKGAIAYVSACHIDEHVRAVLWIDSVGNITNVKPELSCH